MVTPVLATKLFTPTRRADVVARDRLTAQLDRTFGVDHRLTLVSAPAGFGKTTVVAEWIARLGERASHPGAAWLALDAGDNDAGRFLAHLGAALEGIGLDVGAAATAAAGNLSTAALTALVNDIALAAGNDPERPCVLVLDDYHVITSPQVHEAVTFLLDNSPGCLHLVVTTRADPPFPLSRLRARGQLTELRAADLRFTADETHQFLERATGLELSAEDAAALETRTEGWIAGLQLAALSLRGMPDRAGVDAFIADFAGSNRFVIDYLADEVLSGQPEATREFLLHTAVLDRLTGPLCDAVTGRDDGTRMLEELERANLFVVPLDETRTWYRYHHLFADVLRARLLAEAGDRVADLHRRASDWYDGQGAAPDAVAHALAAQDFPRAGYLMEQALPEASRGRQDSLLLGWMRALPPEVVRRSPVLSITTAWSELMAGDLDAVEAWLRDAEVALAAGEADESVRAAWADTEHLRSAPGHIEVYRASLAQARGDVAATVQHARRAVELAGPDDHFVRAAGSGFLGLAAWAAGDVQEALSTFGDAVRSLHVAGNLVDELDSTVVLADMWVAAGRPSRARRLYDDVLRRATAEGEPYPRAVPDLHVGLAELDRELDDLDSAEAHLEKARVLGERASITENRHRWAVASAAVHHARGDHGAATRLLDEAAAAYRPGFYPDVRPIPATRARVHLTAGDLGAAEAWAGERALTVDHPPDHLAEYELLTLARLLLRQGRAHVPAVRGLLQRLHAAALEVGRHGSVREVRMLQALALQADGRTEEALDVLERSFVEAPEPEGNVRLYLDEGTPMLDLLGEAAQSGSADLRGHARRLLRTPPRAPEQPPPLGMVDPLSEREVEVLRLLESELTGPQIARELYVTVNTLRTHTKHIFTKLDVTTRAAAVRRGREQGLL